MRADSGVGQKGWPWSPIRGSESASDDLPHISIVTPSYNQGRFLEQAIRSVLLQGYPNLEYMVFDGGSTDESVSILRRFSEHLAYWRSEPDGGQAQAINMGFERASGEILAWLNSDDLLLPGALHRVAEMQRRHPKAAAWVGACYRIEPSGRLLRLVRPRGLDRESIADWDGEGFFYQPSCFFSAAAWRDAGPLDEGLRYAFDVDLWIRLAGVGGYVAMEEVLSAAVIHEDAKTQAERTGMHAETMAVQIRHGYRKAAEARLARLLERASSRRNGGRRPLRRLRHRLRALQVWRSGTDSSAACRFPLREL